MAEQNRLFREHILGEWEEWHWWVECGMWKGEVGKVGSGRWADRQA